MSWDDTIEMVGEFPVYWAVLKNKDGLVDVWASPYQQLPQLEDEARKGITSYLMNPLSHYTDAELSVAASHMGNLILEDWLVAALINPIYRALKEQREREGGYKTSKAEPAEG